MPKPTPKPKVKVRRKSVEEQDLEFLTGMRGFGSEAAKKEAKEELKRRKKKRGK